MTMGGFRPWIPPGVKPLNHTSWKLILPGWLCLVLLLTSCTNTVSWMESEQVMASGPLAKRYQIDQTSRRQALLHWGVNGILDLETPDQGRRHRIDLLATRHEWIRLRAYGPFQQVALELRASDQWIRWVDPEKRTVTQVPATADGMRYLIGIPLAPTRFFQLVMGWAGSWSESDQPVLRASHQGVAIKTLDGEQLHLDPLQGRVLERSGEAVPGRSYRAVYVWPAVASASKDRVVMPEQVTVTLEQPRVRLELSFKQWHFPLAGPSPSWFAEDVTPGFSLLRPLGNGNQDVRTP
ncbi:MAG: hypothetical protein H7839_09190 [Magnetococcus sp. YQC-5]